MARHLQTRHQPQTFTYDRDTKMNFKITPFLIFYALQSSICFAQPDSAVAPPNLRESNQNIYINEISCAGTVKTSCDQLKSLLQLTPKKIYSEDELNALTIQMTELGYYSSQSIAIQPLKDFNHANLLLTVVEKSTARHAVNGRIAAGKGDDNTISVRPYALYAYSDHNFLGKGYFFQGSLSGKANGFAPSLDSYSLELAAPIHESWIGSARILSLPNGSSGILAIAGVGYQLNENSIVTAYAGNAVGANYTYFSEDNSFIPTTGSLISAGYLRPIASQRNRTNDNYQSIDARTHWQLNGFNGRQGILTASLQFNSQLNPAFRSFANPDKNSPYPESGLTYSLIKTGTDGRRSAYYVGLGNAGISDSDYLFTVTSGYKASLETMDISLGVLLVGKGRK